LKNEQTGYKGQPIQPFAKVAEQSITYPGRG